MTASGLARLRRGVRRYGVRGSLRRLAAIAREQVRAHSVHVWYQLPLDGPRPRRELDPAFVLVRATDEHVPMLDRLWAIERAEAKRRLATGGTLWLVLDGDQPVFSCWTFRSRTPIRAAQGGWLELPDDTVCLEESMTADAYRGRGVAPAAWCTIADAIDTRTVRRMVTTIEEENTASRSAVEKVGFYEIGRMESSKRGRKFRVVVTGATAGDGTFLARLERND